MKDIFFCKENIISNTQIKNILENNLEFLETSLVNNGNQNIEVRNSKHHFISMDENEWLRDIIIENVAEANNNMFNFDINFFTKMQLTVYDKDNFYAKHMDIDFNQDSTRKLTYVLQLQDEKEYSGGDLILYPSEYGLQMPKKKGTLIVFPSFILHEVLPILSGIRYSLVGWCMGKNYL